MGLPFYISKYVTYRGFTQSGTVPLDGVAQCRS